MLRYSLCLLVGASLPALFDRLPPGGLLAACIVASLALLVVPRLRLAGLILLGLGTAGIDADRRLADRLDRERHGQRATISVLVDEFPVAETGAVRFVARPVDRPDLPARLRLTWYDPDDAPALAETWRLTIRLRYPRGYANPGGFDYEGWLFREGIGATGYVDTTGPNYRVHGSPVPWPGRLRRHVDERLEQLFGDNEAAAVMSAVIVGARHRITRQQWERFARTGTSHLMAVSGLHIGLAGGSAFLVGWLLVALLPGRRNLRDWALSIGAACAAGYALLSGFAVPARRALLMASIATVATLCRRRIPPADILALTAMLIVLANPGAVITPGFRLSFAAVAVLLFVAMRHVASATGTQGRLRAATVTRLKQLGTLQLALLAGLFPVVIAEFGRFSPIAPLINVVVLPLFNIAVVPLALAGALLDGPMAWAGDRLLALSKLAVEFSLAIIDHAGRSRLPATENILPTSLSILLLPLLATILPPGWPGRAVGLVAIAATVLNRPAPPPPGCVDYHALDVGQGLAVVVRTHRHSMLFDTGPAFRSGGSAARLAVLPFLRRRGIRKLEELVVSHGDLDHAGGLRDTINGIRIGRVRAGEPLASLGLAQRPCKAGDRWHWDGVEFVILHPRGNSPWHGNNASCVMEVSAGNHRLLLTGDIEAPVETLLAHRRRLRAAEVVFVPHHGSRTSSTEALVRATSPRLAIVSAGFKNRWGQPAVDVTRRWQRSGARVLNTADTGAISQRLCAAGGPQSPRIARRTYRRIWREAFE